MSRAVQGAALIVAGVITAGVGLLAAAGTGGLLAGISWKLAADLIVAGTAAAASGSAALIANALASNRGMNITTREAAGFRQIVWGMQRVGGTTIYQSTTGAGGDSGHYVYNFVVVLATHEIDSVVNVYLDGRQVFWRADGSVGNVGAGTVSTPPTTTVSIAGGQVTAITATGGAGFANVAPARYRVRITGGDGQAAAAYATGGPGAWAVVVTAGGFGYTIAPKAEIQGAFTFGGHARSDDPDPSSPGYHHGYGIGPGGAHYNFDGKVYAEIRFGDQLAGDVIQELATNDPAWIGGYRSTNATAVASINGYLGQVVAVNVTNGGSGYTSPPLVSFSYTGGSGSGATAHAYVSGGRVVSIVVDSPGSGYYTVPDVNLSAGGGVGTSTPYVGGCAYMYINVGYDPAMFPTYPEIRITMRGRNDIYDPRTNATGYSTNWALCVARHLTDRVFGIGDDVNDAQLIAAANVCDEWSPTSQGQERRYALDLHYDTSTSPGDALAIMMPCAAGRLSYIAGEWWIFPAYWQGPSFTFDESALVDTPTWNPYRSFRELINRVTGTYIAPNFPYHVAGNLYDTNGWYYGQTDNTWAFAWQPTNFPMYAADPLHGYATDVFLDEDGGIPLPRELALRGVISIVQSQRLAKIELLRNRQQGSGTFPMMLAAWQMQETDVMQFSFPLFSWANKLLEVTRVDFACDAAKAAAGAGGDEGALAITTVVMVQETAPSVYEWEQSEELTPYVVPASPGSISATPAPPTGLGVADDTTTVLMLANGQTLPRMLVTYTPPNDTYVNNGGTIQIQWRDHAMLHAGGAWIDTGDHDGNSTYCYVDGVTSIAQIDIQARAIRGNGAASTWAQLIGQNLVHPIRTPIIGVAAAVGTTPNPAIGAAMADMPEVGAGDAPMSITLTGDPVLLAVHAAFAAVSGTGGAVTDIGYLPPVTIAYGPPSIYVTITGDGSGAAASVTFTQTGGSGATAQWTPHVTVTSGGANYTAAAATVHVTVIGGGNPGYSNGTSVYSCTLSAVSTVSGQAIDAQVLMDGGVIIGPVRIVTDSSGNASFNYTQLLAPNPAAGVHVFQIQASTPSADVVQSTSRAFNLVNLAA